MTATASGGPPPATMTAARWHGPRDVRLERVPVPAPGPAEALVAVEYVGLCGSDVEEYVAGPVVARPPVTLGHEIVGRVARAAADGSGPAAGTRVVVDVVTGCGTCHWCRRHDEGLCPDLVVTGQHVDGGLARYVLGRAERLVEVPAGLDARRAALAEPVSVAVRAVRKAGSVLGARVAVLGGGALGLLVAQVARAAGAGDVAVVEPDDGRRALAARWGFGALWAPAAAERAALVRDALPEPGPDVVLECSGRSGVAAEAVALCRPGGLAVLVGVQPRPEPLDVLDVVLREKRVVGTAAHLWDDDVAVAVRLLARGAVDVAPLVGAVLPLARAADAFERAAGGRDLRLLVAVDGEDPA